MAGSALKPDAVSQGRAVLYARVSTVEQAEEGESIDAQVRALHDYARRNRLLIVDQFVDEGKSATTDRRPEFQRMIAVAKTKPKPFDVILIHKTDRFARNREHAIVYKNLLRRECGVEVVSITEPFDDSPQGRLMEGILEVMAEFYSANLAQEVRKGMTEKARRGEALGLAPVGYRIGSHDRLELDSDTVPVVRWIFETYAEGVMGYAGIARTLRQYGAARFPGLPPFKWSAQAVRAILRNQTYLGDRIWNKRGAKGRLRNPEEWIVAANAHPPIVSPELFRRAQERMAARIGPRGQLGDYLLRGLVRCDECGASMYLRKMTERNRTEGRPPTLILSCSRYYRGDGDCYFNWIRHDELLDGLVRTLKGIAADGLLPEAYDFLFEHADQQAARESIERALQHTQERYRRQLAAYEAGVINLDELREARERISAEREKLETDLAEARTQEAARDLPVEVIQDRVRAAIAAVNDDTGSPAARRSVLQDAVARVNYSRRQRKMRVTLRV